MKNLILAFTIGCIAFGAPMHAQSTGDATAKSSNAGRDNTWKNWAYAGGAVAAAAIGITLVLLSQGSSANGH